MKNLLHKGLCFGNVNATILASYGDIGGYLADEWQEILLSTQDKMLPVRNSEVSVKEGTDDDYANVIRSIDKTYELLFETLRKSDKALIPTLCENYSAMLSDFTLKVNVNKDESTSDMKYLCAVGRVVESIFENCISIDGTGEDVKMEKIVYVKNVEKKTTKERVDVEKSVKQYFNVCTKMLMGNCDILSNSCNGCESYKKYKKNDFDKFSESVKEFFKVTCSYADKAEKKMLKDLNDMTISSYDLEGEKAYRLVAVDVAESKEKAIKGLEQIASEIEDKQKIVCVDYELVKPIIDAVMEQYGKLLRKYFKNIIKIFNKATEKAKKDFYTVRESFAKASN